jgi:hypothetical protein
VRSQPVGSVFRTLTGRGDGRVERTG